MRCDVLAAGQLQRRPLARIPAGHRGGARGPAAVCLWYARALDAFTFGDDAAASLGIAVPQVRLILFTTAALITATIVSMAGSIGFVGLVVPHVMRFFFGPLHGRC